MVSLQTVGSISPSFGRCGTVFFQVAHTLSIGPLSHSARSMLWQPRS